MAAPDDDYDPNTVTVDVWLAAVAMIVMLCGGMIVGWNWNAEYNRTHWPTLIDRIDCEVQNTRIVRP